MKSLMFLAILFMVATATAQTTTTNSDCTIHGTGDNTASADCTSTTTPPPVPFDQTEVGKTEHQFANLGAALIARHNNKKALKQFCEAHPGEPYRFTLPNGTVTSTGTCDGTVSSERMREILTQGLCAGAIKEGKACYVSVQGDVMTAHSERASLVRYHMVMSSPQFVSDLKQANLKTYVYTNDKDQTFTYDVVSGKEITTEAAAQK